MPTPGYRACPRADGGWVPLRAAAHRRNVRGTVREVYYAVQVTLDRLTTAQLLQLVAIVASSSYDGRISNGALVLETTRS